MMSVTVAYLVDGVIPCGDIGGFAVVLGFLQHPLRCGVLHCAGA